MSSVLEQDLTLDKFDQHKERVVLFAFSELYSNDFFIDSLEMMNIPTLGQLSSNSIRHSERSRSSSTIPRDIRAVHPNGILRAETTQQQMKPIDVFNVVVIAKKQKRIFDKV